MVKTGERHFGQPVIDPTAETELGKILQECGFKLVNRQTSVAVDITEQTAAKTALQNAAAELAERLLPKLAK